MKVVITREATTKEEEAIIKEAMNVAEIIGEAIEEIMVAEAMKEATRAAQIEALTKEVMKEEALIEALTKTMAEVIPMKGVMPGEGETRIVIADTVKIEVPGTIVDTLQRSE